MMIFLQEGNRQKKGTKWRAEIFSDLDKEKQWAVFNKISM